MNELNSDSMRSATRDYAEQIAVPAFDERPIRARAREKLAPQRGWRRTAVAIATAAVIIAAALNGPAVVAQVEHMVQAVLTIGGTQVPVTVQAVSLQQAQRDMPFTVVAPPVIPGYQQSIREIVAQSSPQASRLMVQYTGGPSAAPVTIMESSATAAHTELRIWSSKMPNAQPPQPMRPPELHGAGPKQQATLQIRANGGQQFRVRLTPQSWTAGSTRIDLLSPPGALSAAQMLAIRRAMSR